MKGSEEYISHNRLVYEAGEKDSAHAQVLLHDVEMSASKWAIGRRLKQGVDDGRHEGEGRGHHGGCAAASAGAGTGACLGRRAGRGLNGAAARGGTGSRRGLGGAGGLCGGARRLRLDVELAVVGRVAGLDGGAARAVRGRGHSGSRHELERLLVVGLGSLKHLELGERNLQLGDLVVDGGGRGGRGEGGQEADTAEHTHNDEGREGLRGETEVRASIAPTALGSSYRGGQNRGLTRSPAAKDGQPSRLWRSWNTRSGELQARLTCMALSNDSNRHEGYLAGERTDACCMQNNDRLDYVMQQILH